MAAKFRQLISQGAPDGNGAWTPNVGVPLGDVTDESGVVVYLAPSPATYGPDGAPDTVPAGEAIQTLLGVAIIGNEIATLTDDLNLSLYRGGAVVGGGPFAKVADGIALAAYEATAFTFVTANTALIPPSSEQPVSTTAAMLPLQPGDAIVAGSVSAPEGAFNLFLAIQ